jgi:hypothetical protein
MVDTKKALSLGFGGIKVKGKDIAPKIHVPIKQAEIEETPIVEPSLGLLCAYSDSDSE